jgi:serine/threonine-protein kinase
LVGDAAAPLTKAGMVMGTPAYMPPEQARGSRVDHRADIYAVGAILYEALTGKPPFERADPIATLGAVLTRMPAAPSSIVADLPPALERIVTKAMEKLPERRFATMRELDAALAEFDVSTAGRPSRLSLPPVAPVPYPAGWQGRLLRGYQAPQHLRARLVFLSALAALCTLAWLLTVSCGLLRSENPPGASLSLGEWAVIVLGSLGALSVGGIAWAHHLFWHVWPNASRVASTLTRAAHVLSATCATYAAETLLVRAGGMLRGHPNVVSWLGWDVLLWIVSLAAGYTMWWLESPAKPDKLQSRSGSV